MADARRAPLKDQTDISGARALIVEARFYDDIQDALLEGAVAELKAAGVSHDVITVPGAVAANRPRKSDSTTPVDRAVPDPMIATICLTNGIGQPVAMIDPTSASKAYLCVTTATCPVARAVPDIGIRTCCSQVPAA